MKTTTTTAVQICPYCDREIDTSAQRRLTGKATKRAHCGRGGCMAKHKAVLRKKGS